MNLSLFHYFLITVIVNLRNKFFFNHLLNVFDYNTSVSFLLSRRWFLLQRFAFSPLHFLRFDFVKRRLFKNDNFFFNFSGNFWFDYFWFKFCLYAFLLFLNWLWQWLASVFFLMGLLHFFSTFFSYNWDWDTRDGFIPIHTFEHGIKACVIGWLYRFRWGLSFFLLCLGLFCSFNKFCWLNSSCHLLLFNLRLR